jgi:membrane protein DedA with SNARE-associated domain
MFSQLEAVLLSYAQMMPLPVFAALASFAEEIIAPIPSGPVMLVTGSLASLQGYALPAVFLIAIAAAFGKLAGSLVVYVIADKAEDVITLRFAKLIGVEHAQIEAFGNRLGNGWKYYALLTLLRALPFVPSAVISFGAGVLKVRLRLFVVATFFGSIIRDAAFLYAGYVGLAGAEQLFSRFDTVESVLQAVIICAVVIAGGAYLFVRWQKRSR